MENPLKAARVARQLSRADFARLLNVSYRHLAGVELGYQRELPRSWRESLTAIGLDYDQLNGAFYGWRKALVGGAHV